MWQKETPCKFCHVPLQASRTIAKRGDSRDKRPEAQQVRVGLVLDRDGFPQAHEVFEGNRQDRATVEAMLKSLEKRAGALAATPQER